MAGRSAGVLGRRSRAEVGMAWVDEREAVAV
jgi:hypothetical protein